MTALGILSSLSAKGPPELKSSTAHLFLQMGHIQRADELIDEVEQDSRSLSWLKLLNKALRAICAGEMKIAEETLQSALDLDPDNIMVWNAVIFGPG